MNHKLNNATHEQEFVIEAPWRVIKQRETNRKWRAANPEKARESNRKWYAAYSGQDQSGAGQCLTHCLLGVRV